jgi:hypothetical protein
MVVYTFKGIYADNLAQEATKLQKGDTIQVFGFNDKKDLRQFRDVFEERFMPTLSRGYSGRIHTFIDMNYALTRVR